MDKIQKKVCKANIRENDVFSAPYITHQNNENDHENDAYVRLHNLLHHNYDEEDYSPSATHGDYSPSNPWDAPGMSIHDFI